jgi:DNA topoisomerase IA/predicted RNA-binding Zn-ribbon protein involved in translation (DUF1610 family)
MSKKLFLIEAPGKLKKLRQILGSEYIIKASGGHIRELAKDGDGNLGFDLNGDRISCRFVPRNPQAKKTIAELKEIVRQVDTVILATDEDREGEIIAWHLKEVLKLRDPQRVTYREITTAAVQAALKRPRQLDSNLVNAALARSVLDKLVGFRGSPLVWKLENGAKSVGRVQSAALHILCQREREIQAFKPQDYWQVSVTYCEGFKAYYLGESVPKGASKDNNPERDDAEEEGEQKVEATKVLSEAEADRLVAIARQFPHSVVRVEGKTASKNPPPPFTTSSLQQAAGSRLKWSPDQTMQIAQRLYEGGHITYMRTDSFHLEAEFTAQMEGKLDAIALGQEDWERYIIGWNEDYFAPALEKAIKGIAVMPRSDKINPKQNAIAQGKESKTLCPQCGLKMSEVPSQSKKLHKNYFLKCSGCNTVMFYNKWRKAWELPGEKKEESAPALKLTAHACPVCGEKLVVREYEKEGQQKRMLVCSSPQGRTDKKHKDVAYFESRNVFWSKKYGELADQLT